MLTPFEAISDGKRCFESCHGVAFRKDSRALFEVALAVFLLENHNPTRQRGKFQTRVFPR